jgi:hypothetical protein
MCAVNRQQKLAVFYRRKSASNYRRSTMRQKRETPQPGRAWGADSTSTNLGSNFTSLASIRRRFGTGGPAYVAAKAAWQSENPDADFRVHEEAMRQIAQAVRY